MKTQSTAQRAGGALLLALLAACSAPIPAPVQAPQVKPPAAPPAAAIPTAAPALPTLAPAPAQPTAVPATPIPPTPAPPTAVPPLIAADQRLFDGKVDIGGRALALACYGTGEPTVLIEEGLLSDVSYGTWFTRDLMKITRSCTYLRANAPNSKSDPVAARRTALDQVEDARAMMKAAGLNPPYILVALNYGAMIDVLYAAKYPKEVAGLILIDPDGPGLYQNMAKLMPAKAAGESIPVTEYRAFWENLAQARWTNGYEKLDELIDVPASEALVTGVKTLGELPVVILRVKEHSNFSGKAAPPEPAYYPKMAAAVRAGIAFYEKLSSKTTVVEYQVFDELKPALIDTLTKLVATSR